MNIFVNGNVVTVKTTIKFSSLKKAAGKEGLIIRDEKGSEVYRVGVADTAEVTTKRALFTFADAEDNACMNIGIPNSVTAEDAKEFIMDAIGASLMVLGSFEEHINVALAAWNTSRDALAAMIQIG